MSDNAIPCALRKMEIGKDEMTGHGFRAMARNTRTIAAGIPAERMKMRRPHIVPLSTQALDIMREQHKQTGEWEWVFTNTIRPKDCMSNCTILRVLERLGYKGRMTGHGFRALAMSTIKERLGYRHEVVDWQLAHAPANKVDAAYDRAKFLDERREMMQKWADYLDERLAVYAPARTG